MGRAALFLAAVLSTASFAPAPAIAQPALDARALQPDAAVERDLAPLGQALALRTTIGDRAGEASSLTGLARLARAGGRLDEARTHIEAALERIESLRTAVARQELRSSYLASKQDEYELYVDVLMQMHRRDPTAGYDRAALEASDRGRARSLLDMLAEARADLRRDVSPEILERERTLQRELNARESARLQLLSGRHSDAEAAAIQKDVGALLAAYQGIQAQIRTASPRYAALTQPRPPHADEIRALLDTDTVLVEYALGEPRSYLWIVTDGTLRSVELPGRDAIEEPARRLHELLGRGSQRVVRTQIRLAAADLSRMLLEPIGGELRRKRLLVVTTGVLQYVPFAMLPDPSPTRTGQPLIVDHEVAYLPSASMFKLLRDEHGAGAMTGRSVAVLADPVFDRSDPRAGRAAGRRGDVESARDVERAAAESGVMRFERLVFSRQEAQTIAALAPRGQVLKALDFDASRATATTPKLGEYDIVHFATHTLINSAHPELSGIVLSLVDERGGGQDGFVRVHEIFNLRLAADLVVLSGCQTALGKEIRGEGLIGLTRGFMYAGVPRVVASLWNVKDSATSELMQRFYRGLLQTKLTPAAALRAAQVSMWRDPRWSAPYQWAGFVLQGLPMPMSGQ